MRSAGPFNAAPATMGEIATTLSRRAVSAVSTPASARIGAIDTMGFDGAITMVSASVMSEWSMNAADSAPTNSTLCTGTLCCKRTKYS